MYESKLDLKEWTGFRLSIEKHFYPITMPRIKQEHEEERKYIFYGWGEFAKNTNFDKM